MASKKPDSPSPPRRKRRAEARHEPAPRDAATGAPEPLDPGVDPAVRHGEPDESVPFPVVAVGASAGGIEAFTRLLKALPTDTGMAFVMILHLSPAHESMLTDILARASKMPVADAQHDMRLERDHIYVIPPDRELAMAGGRLQVGQRTAAHGQARPIDHFMRSLAESHGHKAIGIVLSGTANDGTLGLEEIKAAGGITFAQDESAQQEGMPRSAIATGIVDFVLSPEDMARELQRIASHPYVAPADVDPATMQEPAFLRVVEMVRQATGVDFSNYKRNTLQRRITRRMVLHNLPNLNEYVRLLQSSRDEVEALYQDVLINVTSFFRNPEAYEALKTVVFPRLTEDRNRHEPVRIWVLGCSTGEEAYSLAMAYTEYADSAGSRIPLQVFATDVNGAGIEKARGGVYAKSIEQDLSPERLRRFFVEVDGKYRVSKVIRDLCVFAWQNALSDPPFSRVDLVACRNMLIYLEPVLQQRLIPVLHYALQANSFLWLGGSETIGSYGELFELVDPKNKIYRRKGAKRAGIVSLANAARVAVPALRSARALPAAGEAVIEANREADRLLLSRYAPPGVLVDHDLNIVQFRGDTSAYLAQPPGRATLNLLKMLREGLLVAVRGALHQTGREKATVRSEGLRVRAEGGWREVDVVVIPLRREVSAQGAYLVLFEEPAARMEARARVLADEARAAADRIPASHDESSAEEIARLTNELSATREYMQSLVEQQEGQNEELQSANEEIQSANEELQSINEELETSKEEIQSANEELATVNDELQNRNLELSQSNNDLTNLLASVNMAIVMLGPDLCIRRFTQPAEKILNLIQADVGRPIRDIKLSVDVPDLESIVADVIETVTTREREVKDRNGRWYSLRVRPYRTFEKIDGAVLVLVDVDNLKRAGQSIRESETRFEALADTAPVLIWVNDVEGCRFVNRAYEEFAGETEAEIRKHGHGAFVHSDDRDAFNDAYAKALQAKERFEMRVRFRRGDGVYRWMKVVGVPRFLAQGEMVGYVGCTFDITDMAEAEAALRELDRGKNEFLAILAHELRNPLSGVSNAARLLDSRDEAELGRARDIIERQTRHMVRMIDDLLDVSRMTYGKIELRTQPVDVVAILRRAIDATAGQRADMDQKFEAQLRDGALHVKGDPVRLDQVFTNLLANASKFTRRGGRVWVNVEQDAGPGGPCAVIRVRDNGVGIDSHMLPRIFELFVQADFPAERNRGGIGLGLTLAKRLVELHDGTIEAYSAGNALGSEFVVRLPLLSERALSPRAGAARRPEASPGRARVLIVDDNEDSADSLRMLLARSGHDVRTVREGAQAVPTAAEFGADLIVLDIGLPDVDGYTVAGRLRADARTRDAVIVAVTGYGREEDRAKSAHAGIDAHMTKPVDPDLLMKQLPAMQARRAR